MNDNFNKKLAKYISTSKKIIPIDGFEEVIHFYEHREYEMSFEGLIIELMKTEHYPNNFDFNEWKELALYYGLNKETVFEQNFWEKFKKWGELYM